MAEFTQSIPAGWAAIGVVISGVFLLFWGHQLLKFTVAAVGAAYGGFAGYLIALELLPQSPPVHLLAAVVFALVAIAIALLVLNVGIFLLGAFAGYSSAWILTALIHGRYGLFVAIGSGLIGGIAAVVFKKSLLAAFTALSGAWLLIAAALILTDIPLWDPHTGKFPIQYLPHPWPAVIFGGWLVLAALGTTIQLRHNDRTARG